MKQIVTNMPNDITLEYRISIIKYKIQQQSQATLMIRRKLLCSLIIVNKPIVQHLINEFVKSLIKIIRLKLPKLKGLKQQNCDFRLQVTCSFNHDDL